MKVRIHFYVSGTGVFLSFDSIDFIKSITYLIHSGFVFLVLVLFINFSRILIMTD